MRKITKQIMTAFLNQEKATIGNTHTDGNTVYLHGNEILWRDSEDNSIFYMTLSGWNTVTTRDRLNGFLRLAGVSYAGFSQKDFEPYYTDINGNTTCIDDHDTITITL